MVKDPVRILLEVVFGRPPAEPDDGESAAFRKRLEEQVAEIYERGDEVELPPHD